MVFVAKIIKDNRITIDKKERDKLSISIGDHVIVDIQKVKHEKRN